MAIYILLAIILFSGFLTHLEKNKRFNLVKASMIVGIEVLIGSFLFFIIILCIVNSFLKPILLTGVDSLFVLVLLIAVMNGFILYWLNRLVIPKFKITDQVQTLCEYIIQWSLIYITVYQVMFDNLINSFKSFKLSSLETSHLNVADPVDLVLVVLPSLISVWIAIILYKVKRDSI
ncbi:hypothetical protein N1495_01505 [Streptococcus didelphis]|uniref:Uncharacterized protein n=1 Tax=Streptococcus didelphis TaxID=102886 RepID=A0ABY9LG16_9STRE|nr:hypothetical protein [Streptococcus didelphis]WMB27817.1 hypothetical protein N1496_07095 [Streptococcus didelphis]WMB29721.1 hypothetical protein N1495_01505 [Streptococcus didelphis]